MPTGNTSDITARLQRWLPANWFPTAVGTRLYATLCGFASVLATVYASITYATLQARIATATDGFLDLVSVDFFGLGLLLRQPSETDAAFRLRIQANLFQPANSRPAIIASLELLTGNTATLIAPWRPGDVGAWSWGGFGYGTGRSWGSRAARAHTFITIAPPSDGIHVATPAQIYARVAQIVAEGTVPWVNTQGASAPAFSPGPFILDYSPLDGPDVLE